jgi:predicted dehydrogenase
VAAHGKSYLQPAIEDVVFLTMEFASGVLAHVQLSWLDPHKERKLTVVGAKKMVVFDDMEPREKLRIYDKGVDRPPEYGSFGESLAIREGDIFIPRIPAVEPLSAELAHFVRAAQGREAPRVTAEDGVRVVRVLETASRSLARGGVGRFHDCYGVRPRWLMRWWRKPGPHRRFRRGGSQVCGVAARDGDRSRRLPRGGI